MSSVRKSSSKIMIDEGSINIEESNENMDTVNLKKSQLKLKKSSSLKKKKEDDPSKELSADDDLDLEDRVKLNDITNGGGSGNNKDKILSAGKLSKVRTSSLEVPRSMQLHQENLQRTQKRLMISKIILNNFKSYAGKQIIGPFHKNMTSIVGPNGSGKSNLIESLLFVFGRSAKQMRLQKLHQLIHNSSYDQQVKKASVEVHFFEIYDKFDSADYEIVPKSEFVIKRTVHHTSVTKYSINNQESTQAEVIAKLKEKGIDLDNNRFLILQGEVEQISLMKPKGKEREEGDDEVGLLEYLEDIIGSDKYKKEIKEKEKIHESLIGQKREKGELVRIAEKDLEKLQDSKDLAIQYVRKEKELFQIQNLLFQIQRHKANKELIRNQEEMKNLENKHKEEKKKQYLKAKENEDLFKKFNEKKKELQRITDIIENKNQEFQALEKKDIKIKNDLKHLIENEVKSKEEIEQLEKQRQQILNNCQEVKEKLPKAKKELEEVTISKEQEEKKYQDMLFQLKQNTEQLQSQKKKIESKLDPYQKKIDETKSQIQAVKNEINIIIQGAGGYQEEIKSLQQKISEFDEEIAQGQDNLKQIDEAMEVMLNEKQNFNQNLQNERKREENLRQDISQINQQISQSKAQNFQNQQDSFSVVNELLKAQQSGFLQQIKGRLGDLGAIDPKFDIAISTACPQLNNIVVENIEAAQNCVEFLKQNRLGKSTFIAMDKVTQMWQYQMEKQFEAPQGSQRIFDLVRVKDPNLRAVFYSVLKDTLVCDNLDKATEISYGQQRYRVVTIDGNIVETSGAISGGGKPRQGLMSRNIKQIDNSQNDEMIDQLKEQLHRKQQELDAVIQNKKNLDLNLQEVLKDEREAKGERQKLQDMIDFNLQEKQSLLKKIDELTKILSKKNQNEKNKASLEQKLVKLNAEYDNLEVQVRGLREQLQEVDKKIVESGGEDFKRQKQVFELLNSNFLKLDKEIQKMNKILQSATNSLEVIEQEKKNQQNKLKKYEEDQLKIKQAIEDLENKCLEIIGAIKANEEKRVLLENELNKNDAAQQAAKKLLEEIMKSLEKTKDELDKAKEIFKKSENDYKVAAQLIEKNRKDYENIIKNYDFLDQLDEIAAFDKNKVTAIATGLELEQQQQQQGEVQQQEGNQLDTTVNNMTMLEIPAQKGDEDDDEDAENQPHHNRKKIKVGLDKRLFKKYDVGQDLTQDELDQLERVSEQLNIKKAFEEDNLKKLQPNINSIIEFKNKYMDFKQKLDVFSKVINEMKQLRVQIDLLRKKRFEEFMSGFNVINCKLKETYQLLTHGGDAELELIDSLDPFSEGVVFSVRPYKKSWKQMQKLSGGEKTLSSLALVFSLHYFKPNPLYFMDEIDAALDFKNVQIVAKFIKERTKNAQFIIISLRNNMFELADRLVGIYKTQDTTKTISIQPQLFQQFLPSQTVKTQVQDTLTQTHQNQQQQFQQKMQNQTITPSKADMDNFIENLKSNKKTPKPHLSSSTKKAGQEEDEF